MAASSSAGLTAKRQSEGTGSQSGLRRELSEAANSSTGAVQALASSKGCGASRGA